MDGHIPIVFIGDVIHGLNAEAVRVLVVFIRGRHAIFHMNLAVISVFQMDRNV